MTKSAKLRFVYFGIGLLVGLFVRAMILALVNSFGVANVFAFVAMVLVILICVTLLFIFPFSTSDEPHIFSFRRPQFLSLPGLVLGLGFSAWRTALWI